MAKLKEDAIIASETTTEVKQFSLSNVDEFMSENELKNTKAGSMGGNEFDLFHCDPTGTHCWADSACAVKVQSPFNDYFDIYWGICVYEPYVGLPSGQCYCKID